MILAKGSNCYQSKIKERDFTPRIFVFSAVKIFEYALLSIVTLHAKFEPSRVYLYMVQYIVSIINIKKKSC